MHTALMEPFQMILRSMTALLFCCHRRHFSQTNVPFSLRLSINNPYKASRDLKLLYT